MIRLVPLVPIPMISVKRHIASNGLAVLQGLCGSDGDFIPGQIEINSPNSSGIYQLSDNDGSPALFQKLDFQKAEYQCAYADLVDTTRIFEVFCCSSYC